MPKSRHRVKMKRKPKPIKWKSDEKSLNVDTTPRVILDYPRPSSNSKMEFTLIHTYPPTAPETKMSRIRLDGNSIYQVTYFLAIPGVDIFHFDVGKNLFNSGKSLLHLPNEDILIITINDEKKTENLQIYFYKNQSGDLSHIRLRIRCNNFEEAERFAHERVSTILSYWSFIYDIGIEIGRYEILEETTGSKKFSVGLVGKTKLFDNNNPFFSFPEYRRIFAVYREAMNTSNPFYQMLCLWKITEGIISLRRNKIKKIRPLRKGEQGFEPHEKFPIDINMLPVEDELTKDVFEQFLGKSFQEVRESFKNSFRDAIAHLIKFEDVLDADRYDDVIKCAKAIPILKYMARTLLQNDLNNLEK